MLIEITYNVTDVFMSTTETPVYVEISFEQPSGSAAVWGSITGTLSNQTDLQNALNAKLDESTIDGGTEGQILSKASGTDFDFAWINNYAKYLATNVRNQTGSTIAAFQVVYISGATGNKPLISLADADTEATSSKTYGVTATSIANNGTGDVVTAGELSGINTSAFNEGDLLWLSTTAGGVVTSPPAEPAHAVFIGYVVRSHPTLGTIDVSIQNGYELNELHGVQITSAANNNGLFYNSSNGLWENKSIATVLGYTPEQPLTFNSPLSRSVNAVSIPQATGSVNGFLSATDWTTFNSKQAALGFTPANAATTLTINGVTFDLSANRSWTIAAGISGSGAAGQVTYWDGTSSVSGSNNLFWDNANGRLGIGTNAPAVRTHIVYSDNTFLNGLYVQNTNTGTNAYSGIGLQDSAGNVLAGFQYVPSTFSAVQLRNSVLFASTGQSKLAFVANSGVVGGVAQDIYFATLGNKTNLYLYGNTGNLVLQNGGTFTDNGQRLQVYGDTLLRGSGNTSATTALTVQNSSSVNILRVLNDGQTILRGTTNNDTTNIFRIEQQNGNGRFLVNANGQTIIAGDAFTSSETFVTVSRGNFNPTSGTATHTSLAITPTINQTGGANGITRALYVNPTLTAAADFRAIETSAGNVLFGASGTGFFWDNTNSRLGIGTNAPSNKLVISGSETASSGFARGILINTTLNAATNSDLLIGLDIQPVMAQGAFTNASPVAMRLFNPNTNAALDYGIQFRLQNTRTGQTGADGFLVSIDNAAIPNAYIYNYENASLIFGTNSTVNARLYPSGNLVLQNGGTFTDGGQRLQVYGDTLLRGSGATLATTALTVQNSSSTNLFSVRNDGAVGIGTNAPSASLDVVGNIHFRAILRGIQSGGDVVIVGMNAANTAEASRINLRNQSDGSLSIGNQFSGGYISLQCGNGAYTERMRIKNNGQIRFVPLSSAPASPEAGDVYYDSTLNKLRVYTTAWETITSI